MDFALSDEQKMILAYGEKLVRDFDRAHFLEMAEKREFPAEMWRRMGADGFLGMMVPEEYGGAGQGMTEMALLMEGISQQGIPSFMLIAATMVLAQIAHHGNEDQKRRLLPAACRGETVFCFVITEPDAGSNSMRIATTARRRGDRFVLNGQKTFITGADIADYGLVVARTTPLDEVKRKTDGFTLFVVDFKQAGIEKTYIPTGIVAPERQFQVFFDDIELGPEDVLGEVDRGFDILFESLNPERIVMGAMGVGIGRYVLRRAAEYASERRVFGQPIGAHQGVQHPLAAARVKVEMAGLMTYRGAWAYDQGLPAGDDANMAKYFAGEAAIEAVDAAMQAHGGNGFTKEYGIMDLYPMARLLRTAPLNREVILSYISEKTMGMPRSY